MSQVVTFFDGQTDWSVMGPELWEQVGTTMYMVGIGMLIGGFVGLLMGLLLYLTRPGNLLQNAVVFTVLNVLINIVRPIPFIIFVTAIGPLTRVVVGTTLGPTAGAFAITFMAAFAFARLVEQNLVALDPGVIEAARAMGASKFRVIWSVVIPEALGPLILAYVLVHRCGGHVRDGGGYWRARARRVRAASGVCTVQLGNYVRDGGCHHYHRSVRPVLGELPGPKSDAAWLTDVTATVGGGSVVRRWVPLRLLCEHRTVSTLPA